MARWTWMVAVLALGSAAWAEPATWTFKDLGEAKSGEPNGPHFFVAQTPSTGMLVNVKGKPEAAQLAIRCDQKGFFITILWPTYVNADTYNAQVIAVDYKLDNSKPRTIKLHRVDQAAIALGRDGYRLLKELDKAHTLSVHLPDFNGGQDATFDIEGIDKIYDRVTAFGCVKN